MKYLSLFLLFLSAILLVGCIKTEEKHYTDLENHHVNSYFEAENKSNNRYVVYYYDSTDEQDALIKNDIISFFENFNYLDFYILDTSGIEIETSSFGEYDGEPIIYVVSSMDVLEEYIGDTSIRHFISQYTDIDFDYDLFEDQHLSSIYDALEIENDNYILYYYLESCPHCINTKPHFLPWAFTKSAEDIYFINGAEVEAPETFPTELIILQSGTPIVVLMSNGMFADEYYSGTDDVIGYIEEVGEGDITSETIDLDYDYFSDVAITDLSETLTISDNIHIEYYYSPYCSHCNTIKDDVLSFFYGLDDMEFYLIDVYHATGQIKIDDFIGTPTLYVIDDNDVLLSYVGYINVLQFINEYNDGTLDFSSYQ